MTRLTKPLAAAAAVVLLGVGLWAATRDAGAPEPAAAAFVMPTLDDSEARGQALFQANCAACHGDRALGSDSGPPLVHRIYEPSHHGDMAFLLAARNGVRAHHWDFGNMPPVDGVTDDQVALVTGYVRALQRANGIR